MVDPTYEEESSILYVARKVGFSVIIDNTVAYEKIESILIEKYGDKVWGFHGTFKRIHKRFGERYHYTGEVLLLEDLLTLQDVKDQPFGFEEKYAEHIFGVFQRLHGMNEYAGNGIGLAICRKIVERHGVSIEANGELGEGATFSVILPASQNSKDDVIRVPTE